MTKKIKEKLDPKLKQTISYKISIAQDMWHLSAKTSEICISTDMLYSSVLPIDNNRLRRHRALEFRQPVTQGKHSVKRSLYKALHKPLSLVLRRWRAARTISYRPFVKHQQFAAWSLFLRSFFIKFYDCIFVWKFTQKDQQSLSLFALLYLQ